MDVNNLIINCETLTETKSETFGHCSDVFMTYTSSLCEICSAPVHVTSTQVLTIPVIMESHEANHSTKQDDTEVVYVTETVGEPEATAYIASNSISDTENGEDTEVVHVTVTAQGEPLDISTGPATSGGDEQEHAAASKPEDSEGHVVFATPTIQYNQGYSEEDPHLLSATKTVNGGAV
ncbi:hypothetical protein BD408DRAFT_398494 [Parasitella parasitica]|nr:hypothetical protein BD408DRAFT_398494 [Parasitella parasitica]